MTDYTMILVFLTGLIIVNGLTAMCVLVTTKGLHHKLDMLSSIPPQHVKDHHNSSSSDDNPSHPLQIHATTCPDQNPRSAKSRREQNL